MTRIMLTTALNPGAVAILQLTGPGVASILAQLTGVGGWQPQRVRLVDFAGIDEGLAVMLREDWAQLMPHGGPRVVTLLMEKLVALGAEASSDVDSRALFPEAQSAIESDMLLTLSRAASPAAINLLLRQPALWRRTGRLSDPSAGACNPALDRLIDPPTVVVVGAPNVGKSTLTNRMLGRTASVVADLPGTTRDWVAGLAEIRGVAVRWLDTPGIRPADDPIERQAIELSRQAVAQADILIAMRDPATPWPPLPREPDIRVVNKVDHDGAACDELTISALHGRNIAALETAVLKCLKLDTIDPDVLWAFSPTLRRIANRNDREALSKYVEDAKPHATTPLTSLAPSPPR